uniref:Transmembrane protein n=1 Tax=Dulem virus 194 TaxID=3145671 RepID=A0AAU8AY53_9VIRU
MRGIGLVRGIVFPARSFLFPCVVSAWISSCLPWPPAQLDLLLCCPHYVTVSFVFLALAGYSFAVTESEPLDRGEAIRGRQFTVLYFILLLICLPYFAKPRYFRVPGFVSSIWSYRLFKS